MKPYLSVIIPAYNEEARLPATLVEVHDFLSGAPYSSEVIVVNDGSTDSTAKLAREFCSKIKGMKVIDQENTGKGGAVRRGMLEAAGEIRLFTDADNSTSLDQFNNMIPYFEKGYSVVFGSRTIEGAVLAVPQPWYKQLAGKSGNLFVQAMLLPGIWDTQCGFKAFTATAAEEIFQVIECVGWGFDMEALTLAKRMGLKLKEMPVVWVDKPYSHVSFGAYFKVLADVLEIKWRLRGFEKRYKKEERSGG